MKKYILTFALFIILLSACGNKNKSSDIYPDNFTKIGDVGRVKYMMERVTPDSLARFVIDGALGRNEGAPIDSLDIATLYIYEHLQGDALDSFSIGYDSYVESLPLDEKMKIYMLASSEDPQKLGYHLGLEYVGSIRIDNKNADQVEKELKAFKKACGSDTATYRRFLIGFHTVLEMDKGNDLNPEIYKKFINYE